MPLYCASLVASANVVYIQWQMVLPHYLTDADVNVADGSHLNIMMADVDANVVDRMTTF